MEHEPPQAAGRGGVKGHVLEPFLRLAGGFGFYIGGQTVVRFPLFVNEKADGPHIGAGVEQDAAGRFAVPPGTARLLIVAFQVLGHVVVDDKPDVGLINAHAKGVGGHHDLDTVIEEIVLVFPADLRVQLGVVGCRPDTPALEQAGRLVHLFGGAAIDDARMVALPQDIIQQDTGLLAGQGTAGLKIEVGAVKACRHLIGVFQGQMGADVIPDVSRGGGRERPHHRAAGQAVHKGFDAQVAGAEILPPLADAVGLVHRDHADEFFLRKPLEARHLQPLRGHIDDLIPRLPAPGPPPGLSSG